jgi:hypothetical protein
MLRHFSVIAALLLAQTSAAQAQDPSVFAGVAGATLIDSGAMLVSGAGPFDREEGFEYLKRPDGGYVLLNTITAANGAYRVRARFNLDAQWRSTSAHGIGLYEGKPVNIAMRRDGDTVKIAVRPADPAQGGPSSDPVAQCAPDCFINMSPSITSMFVMTRHYDFARGGGQLFRWTGQDLDRVRTLSGGTAALTFKGNISLPRATGGTLTARHFTFIETMPNTGPNPAGGTYSLDFDLWTDTAHKPLGFRIRFSGGAPAGVVGWRTGYEDVRARLLAALSAP